MPETYGPGMYLMNAIRLETLISLVFTRRSLFPMVWDFVWTLISFYYVYTGFKAYNPQEKKSRRWAITRPNFKDNFALHFAVGYPF